MLGKIGIIGIGNMGLALLRGIAKKKLYNPDEILIFDKDELKSGKARREIGCLLAKDIKQLAGDCQGIILAVKPKDLPSVLKELAGVWPENGKFLVSIAAGVTLSYLEKKTAGHLSIIRAMPNMPAQIGEGLTALSFNQAVKDRERKIARSLFGSLGRVLEVDEKWMDAVTAISGSGPAYFFIFLEALIEAAGKLGLDEKTGEILVKEAASGSVKLALASTDKISVLRDKVTSSGGTTEAAMKVLASRGFKDMIYQAVKAAEERSVKLRKTVE